MYFPLQLQIPIYDLKSSYRSLTLSLPGTNSDTHYLPTNCIKLEKLQFLTYRLHAMKKSSSLDSESVTPTSSSPSLLLASSLPLYVSTALKRTCPFNTSLRIHLSKTSNHPTLFLHASHPLSPITPIPFSVWKGWETWKIDKWHYFSELLFRRILFQESRRRRKGRYERSVVKKRPRGK